MKYAPKTAFYKHQEEYFNKHKDKPYWALFMEMGAGKTKCVIDNAAYLYEQNDIDLLVIVAPNSLKRGWVLRELPKHLPERVPVQTHIWTGKMTLKEQKIRKDFLAPQEKRCLKVIAFNCEAFSAHKNPRENKAVLYLAELIRAHNNKIMGVVDESSVIKEPKSTRTKRLVKFGQYFKYRRILSGTPITESPFGIYTQSEFLKPGLLGFKNYHQFTLHHGVFESMRFGTGRSFQKLKTYRYLDELKKKIESFSTLVRKEDCLDLPPKVYKVLDVEMTKEQKTAYNQMRLLLLHEVEEDTSELIKASNALHKLQRLKDIVLGYARGPEGKIFHLDHNRLDAVDSVIAEVTGKVILFADTIPALEDLHQHLARTHGHDAVALYYGATSDDERAKIETRFMNPDSSLRFFIGSLDMASKGLDFWVANTVIYYSNDFPLETRVQSEDRAHRAGQTKSVLYVDLISPNTVDEKIMNALKSKVNISAQVVPMFKEFLGEPI